MLHQRVPVLEVQIALLAVFVHIVGDFVSPQFFLVLEDQVAALERTRVALIWLVHAHIESRRDNSVIKVKYGRPETSVRG